ncbi:MAG: response regulator [Azoarcus sp.]|jgi:signal transduction histidine kinase/ActR/RegA family two-component response regulator|nr:response regulator [Azoarcus sp.]
MSIRAQILLSVIGIATLIIAAGLGIGGAFTRDQMRQSMERDLSALTDTADRLISFGMDLLKAEVALSASTLVEAEAHNGNFHKVLQEQANARSDIWALTVIEGGKDGAPNRIVDFSGSLPVHPDYINSNNIQRALAGEDIISTTRIDPASGKLVLHICVPMYGNRVLVATIDGMYFSNILKDIVIWDSGHIFIIDKEGYVLANPRQDWVKERRNFINLAKTDSQYQDVATVISTMTQGKEGIGMYSIDGSKRFCAYKPISSSQGGWALGVVGPQKESPLQDTSKGLLIVAFTCIALSIVLAVPVSAHLEKPYSAIKKVVGELEYQKNLLHTTNKIAEILLRIDSNRFEDDIYTCMGLMAQSANVGRVRIFQNRQEEDDIRAVLKYEWTKDAPKERPTDEVSFLFKAQTPNWYAKLSVGENLFSLTRDFPERERKLLEHNGVLALLSAPIFLKNTFWGFTSFDNCEEERLASPQEVGLLVSGMTMLGNALERNMMEEEMTRARKEAEAHNEAKSRFLANISHEIRTPLNAIIGLSELSLDTGGLTGENKDNLSKIYSSGITLLGLVNDILDLSKIESGKFEIIPSEYDIASLINDTINLNSVRIGSKPVSLHLHVDETLPNVLQGDDLRLKQMLNNLLSNAIKYTTRGRVDWYIACERDGDSVWLTSVIKDTGIGIRPDDIQKLFSDYNQVDTRANRKIEGSGLGLSIAKKIAKMMDGDITVESEYGVGSTFTLRIRQGFVNDVPIGPDVAENLRNFKYFDEKRNRRKFVRIPLPYARVLVVDDVPINLDVARGLLRHYGMKVDCVDSGIEAIARIREEKIHYDAIFMDHMMPEIDGIEATRIIREEIGTDYAKNIPIIALTANAIVGNENMFLSKGFQAFLSKPIDIRALDATLDHWVRDKTKETGGTV